MKIEELPKWMNVIPVLTGVAFAIIGMDLFPAIGIRNTFGPILGLPIGFFLGFGVLSYIAKNREK